MIFFRKFFVMCGTLALSSCVTAESGQGAKGSRADAMAAEPAAGKGELGTIVKEAFLRARYKPADAASFGLAETLFADIMRQDSSPATVVEWNRKASIIGFQVTEQNWNKEPAILLMELPTQATGKGTFVFFKNRPKNMSLLMPHGDSDLMTDDIGSQICVTEKIYSCAFNTVNRKSFDWAHEPESFLQSFVRVQAGASARLTFNELHGFEGRKRKSFAGSEAEMIVSNGRKASGPCLKSLWQAALGKDTLYASKFFGAEVQELGATTNEQMKALKAFGKQRFFHFETSNDFRKKLVKDADARKWLFHSMESLSGDVAFGKDAAHVCP